MTFAASVIVPVLNQIQDWLDQAVRSALQQSVPTEVVVVTSPHTGDGNRRLLSNLSQQFENLRLLQHGPDVGFAGALNLGIRRAASDRIGFLLSDDWLESTAVEVCLRHDTDIVSTSIRLFCETRAGLRSVPHPALTQDTFQHLPTMAAKASYLEHFFLFKKQALLDVGGVDESIGLVGPDDYDLVWTLLERDLSVSVVSERLYNYRGHSGERLTLRPYEDQRIELEMILDKHHVIDPERSQILEAQRRLHLQRDR